MGPAVAVSGVSARSYTIPTDALKGDGTFTWDKTTIIVVEVAAGGITGLGYTYADASVAALVGKTLASALMHRDAMDVPGAWIAMQKNVRNLGRSGLAACAISAVDTALWDLKAKLLEMPLARLLGRVRESVPVYGSGGFTTYSDRQLHDQLSGWVERDGCSAVKMKIGADPEQDCARVAVAKAAIGGAQLFVDANGAFSPREALHYGHAFAASVDIRWFEEPVSSDDLSGLRLVRENAPSSVAVAAGEYTYTADDAREMLAAGAIDVQQADATRCGGITGFLKVGTLCEAHHIDLSGHCAPALHLHAACAVQRFRHLEWFHDHVRIERMLFDGAPIPEHGAIRPDLTRPGLGLVFKRQDADHYAN